MIKPGLLTASTRLRRGLDALEVVTQYGIEGDAHTLSVTGDPNGTVYKEFYGTGWQRGLPVQIQVWAGGTLQKTTTTLWTQDDTNVSYQTNPRMNETNVIDSAGNHSRTKIAYNTFTLPSGTSCSLPADVDEYEANATTVARRTHTDYNLTSNYLNARLIGLPQAKFLYEGTSTLKAKSTYVYDWGGEYLQNLPAAATQHDGGYSTDFVVGRGNLVDVLRWDVTDPNNSAKALESKMGYDIDGSVVFARDPLNHQTTISYNDAFSASGTSLDASRSFATFAYPTMVTDPDGYSSSLWYRYDFGAKTRAQGPPPANQPNGIIQTFSYDDAARIQQVTTANTGAYTHYVYGPNYVQSYSTVNTIAANFLQADLYAIQVFDGAGRVIGAANNHPGSTGGYSLLNTIYDLMGRAVKVSNPGEINNSWVPVGDEAAGLTYTQQTYDWKGRPLVTTHLTDGAQKYASYTACGCAGSEITTLTDEVGRQQKVYSDVLGRQWKTEILDGTNIYSTSVSVYNGRDQVVRVKQYSGQAPAEASSTNAAASCPTGSCQETTMSYDGYGRLQAKHSPEQDVGTATTYAYNSDYTVHSITDARGASATYGYAGNNRRLVTGITYNAPSDVTATSVSFGYDAVGNRASMVDGVGTKTYSYNQLSQLMSEMRTLTNVGTFTLNYDYNLAGELKTVSDPWGAVVNYGFDSTGRLNNITGSGYGNASQFLSNMQYRAWGTLKSETYGNGFTESAAYNTRLQMTGFQVRQANNQLTMSRTHQYYADGALQYSHDGLDDRFDRAAAYDHSARVKEAYSGSEARDFINGTISGSPTGPYRQSYQYNVFDQIAQQMDRIWSDTETTVNTFVNNRQQGWIYNASGQVLIDDNTSFTYDVSGRIVAAASASSARANKFDADGRLVWTSLTHPNFLGVMKTSTTYYLNSSVLGGLAVAELDSGGQKTKGNIYASGRKVAQALGNYVTFAHEDPVTGSRGDSTSEGSYGRRSEYNADGINIGFQDPTPAEPDNFEPSALLGANFGFGSSCSNADPNCKTCYLDGFEQPSCGSINWEAAQQCPDNDCGPRTIYDPNSGQNIGVLPVTTDPNTGLWMVSGTVDQYGKFPITIKDLDGNVISSSAGTWKKVGALDFTSFLNSPSSSGEPLSPCLQNALRKYFPQQTAEGKTFSPIDDARFIAGIPAWARAGGRLPGAVVPGAITLGLYDIYYDTNSLHITGGSSEDLKGILEEVSHTVQFLQVWAGMGLSVGGKYNPHVPNYADAQLAWKQHYAYYSAKALGYGNDVEKWAKNNSNLILQELVNNSQLRGSICGFDLTNYKIEIIH